MTKYNSIDEEIEALYREIDSLEETLEHDDDWRSIKETENEILNLRREIARLEEMRAARAAASASEKSELQAKRSELISAIERLEKRMESCEHDMDVPGHDAEFYAQAERELNSLSQQTQSKEQDLEYVERMLQNMK